MESEQTVIPDRAGTEDEAQKLDSYDNPYSARGRVISAVAIERSGDDAGRVFACCTSGSSAPQREGNGRIMHAKSESIPW